MVYDLKYLKFNMRKVTAALLLCSFLCAALSLACRADEYEDEIASMRQKEAQTQDMISNLEKQTKATKDSISLLQQQRAETESTVSDLKNKSAILQSTVSDYSDKLDELDSQISETEDALSAVSAEIVNLNGELNDIRARKEEIQRLLNQRMKNVYENGGKRGMLERVLEASSFSDFLNRSVYVTTMVKYDQKRIEECRVLEAELNEKLAQIEDREDELSSYQDSLDDKYSELESIADEVQGMLDSTNSSMYSEAGKLANYDAQLAELDKTMKALEAQTAAAQAELAKQVAQRLAMKKEDTSGSYAASASELEWLAATIQAEADGESYTGKLAVGSVIMNRVKSSAFPNSVVAVITQNMQFASYRSGKVELIIQKGPNSTCIKAAQEVLGGARVGDYLFFMTKYYADYYMISEYTMIGNHAFFYQWKVKEEPVPEEPAPEQENSGETGEQSEESHEEAPAEEQHSEEEHHEEQPEQEQPKEEQPKEEQPEEEHSEEEHSEEDNSEGNGEGE